MASSQGDPEPVPIGLGLPPLPEDVKNTHAIALALRRNFSLWYEQLDPSTVTSILKDEFRFTEGQIKEIESYSDHPRAQTAAIFAGLFTCNITNAIALLGNLSGHEGLTTQLREDYQLLMGEVQPIESLLSPVSSLEEISESFYKLLHDVTGCLNELPNTLVMLKQALASLVLPLGDGKVASIVKSSLYNDAKSVAELFSLLSPYINPLSVSLLWYCVNSTESTFAIAKITAFSRLLKSNDSLILCSDKWIVPTTLDGLNDLNTPAMPGAEVAHTTSFDQLQSVHFCLFGPSDHTVLSKQGMRVSARINRKSISLAEQDHILTAISGFLKLPKCAFTYIGCTEQPLCLTWMVSKEMQTYIKNIGGSISGEYMLSEQGIVGLMIGDWLNYHCLTVNESESSLCAFYGIFDRLECLLSHQIDVNWIDYNGDTGLIIASIAGHLKVAEVLIQANANKDHKRKTGATALLCACEKGHIRIVQLLIQARANLDISDNTGTTALICACENGHINIVQLLIQAGASLDTTDKDECTALIRASVNNHDEVVQLLVDAGADKEIQNKEGDTGLTIASIKGHEKVVEVLVRAKANKNLKRKTGATALICACGNGHIEVVQLLIQARDSLDITDNSGCTALIHASGKGHDKVVQLLVNAGANKDIQDKNGCTALIHASTQGYDKVVYLLVNAGANKDIQDVDGDTSLTIASLKGHKKVVEVLIKAEANLDLNRKTGATALYCASEKGHIKIIQLLVQAGAKLDVPTSGGLTALHIACIKGNVEILRLFIQAGCNHIIDVLAKEGWTALHHACGEGLAQISELLIQAGACLDSKTPLGYTPLIMASDQNHLVVVQQLIQAGADLNLYDEEHRTALFWASMKGHAPIVRELLQAGANATISDKDSQTPFDIGSINGHVQVCQVFTEMGTQSINIHY